MTQHFSETLAETFHITGDHTPAQPIIRPAIKRMARALTSVVLAGSLVIGSAAPSLADKRGDNLAKVLGAAIVLGLILNANKGHADPAPAPQPQPQPKPHHQPRPRPQHTAIPRVPANCAISIDSNSGNPVSMYSESCMRDAGFDYRLPDCARPVRIYGKRDYVYSEQCLRDAGFRIGYGDDH
ncbi:MAG: hypothetical protein ACOH2M_10500 [Cypionkella sp.]